MAPIHNPDEGIQPVPPAPAPPPASSETAVAAPSPAKAKVDRAAAFARRLRRIDALLVLLLLLLSFFVASFAVQNSDFWLHLATGRLIADGDYELGVDPFSYASEGPWINQSWLYDWALYGLYQILGGAGLLVLKALLVVVLVVVLFQIRRPGARWLLPVLILALAVLALSPRLLFQPTILSYLFLAVTLWVLLSESGPGTVGRVWWLPVLFVLWVNVDSWFVLAPLTLALFLLGTWIAKLRGQAVRYAPRTLVGVLAVGLGACVINPHHVQAFQLPGELALPVCDAADAFSIPLPEFIVAGGRTAQNLRAFDPINRPVFSPFWSDHRGRLLSPFSPSHLAYYVLLALGLLSFLVHSVLVRSSARFPWPRVFVWSVFAALSAAEIRLVPFFALVSAATLTLNFQDLLWREPTSESAALPPGWLLLGRLVSVLGMIALVALAWPGWLGAHDPRQEIRIGDAVSPRRVAWRIEPNASAQKSALALRKLHEAGKVHNGFNDTFELAHYWAWFCPEIKSAFDSRWPLFARASEDFSNVHRELRQEASRYFQRERTKLQAWTRLATERNVDFLATVKSNAPLIRRRWLDEAHWPFLYQDGRVVIFAWNPQGHRDAFAGVTVDLERAAFGPVADDDKAPAVGPEPPAKPRGFLYDYAFGLPPLPMPLDEAALLQDYYQLFMRRWIEPYMVAWGITNFHTAAVTSAVAPGTVAQVGPSILLQGAPSAQASNLGPPAAAVLMVRRARAGVAQSPLDHRSYLRLHEALTVLSAQETFWGQLPSRPITVWRPGLPLEAGSIHATLRRVQQIQALKTAALLEPSNPGIHLNLAELYIPMEFLDVVPEHWRAALRHYDKLRPPVDASKKDQEGFQQSKQFLQKSVDDLEKLLKERREEWSLHAGPTLAEQVGAAVIERSERLVDKKAGRKASTILGLPSLALSVLQKAPLKGEPLEDAFITHTQMGLLLMLGRAGEVRDALPSQRARLEAAQKQVSPAQLYQLRQSLELIALWAAAAIGDYREIDSALAELEKVPGRAEAKAALTAFARQMFLIPPINANIRINSMVTWPIVGTHELQLIGLSQVAAEFRILRGLMALERGDTADATAHFEYVRTEIGDWVPHPGLPIARRYLEFLKRQ